MTDFPNKMSSMKYSIKLVHGLAAGVGVPHGDGDGAQNSTQMSGGVKEKGPNAFVRISHGWGWRWRHSSGLRVQLKKTWHTSNSLAI